MKARKWVAVDFGGPGVLRRIDTDVPAAGRGEVTIDVRAAGMNPADAKHIAAGPDRTLLPLSIGYEVAGIVTARRAAEVLDGLPPGYRSQMITETGRRVLAAVPRAGRPSPAVRDLAAVIAATAPAAAQLAG